MPADVTRLTLTDCPNAGGWMYSSILSKLNLERRAQAAAFVAKHRFPGAPD